MDPVFLELLVPLHFEDCVYNFGSFAIPAYTATVPANDLGLLSIALLSAYPKSKGY